MGNFVAIDLGASGTRYTSDSGKIALMPNNMVFMDVTKEVDMEPYDSSIENALEVIINKEGGLVIKKGDEENTITETVFPAKALIGTMADRYASTNVRPSMLEHKYTQKINYVSVITTAAITRLTQNVGEDITLYIALPPTEIKKAKEAMLANLVGKYIVEFPKFLGGATVKLNIQNVCFFEESFMAMVSYFFTMQGIPKEEAKPFMAGQVLSLDIGASTTDIAIVKDGRYIDKSGQTFKEGGNIARDELIDLIREEYAFELPIDDAERTMSEGRLQLGSSYKVISDLVTEAKKVLAKQVVSNIESYFNRKKIPLQSINAIIVSGGGSMQSQYINDNAEVVKTSEPLSEFVTEELKKISPNTKVVPYGDGARLANIKGLFVRAKVDSIKAAKQAEAAK